MWIHTQLRIDAIRYISHLGHLLHYNRIIHSLISIFSPRKWSVILYEDPGNIYRINLLKTFDDHISCLFLILTFYFLLSHFARARNGLAEIVSVCRTDIRNITSGLEPHEVGNRWNACEQLPLSQEKHYTRPNESEYPMKVSTFPPTILPRKSSTTISSAFIVS